MCMKRVLIALLFIGLMSPFVVLAGGIVTNSNQSAAYVRMLARDASTSIDAVYYNPAGLTKLENGFHLSLSNQSIFQKKTIENTFQPLNEHKYIGDVSAPVFPDFYAVYKKDKLALAFGLTPNAGGGSADYKTGLPSFEIPFSAIPMSLSASGIPTTAYSSNASLKGTSVFWGAQFNASYAINDMISVSVGLRYIYANNTYKGAISGIMVDPTYAALGFDGTMRTATSVFHTLSLATANTVTTYLNPLITGGAGGMTLAQLVGAGLITAGQSAQLSGGLGSSYNAAMTVNNLKTAYETKAAYLEGNSAATADQTLDSKQNGTAITPIFGVNLTFGEKLNIGIKYEMNTSLTLKNDTKNDVVGGVNADGSLIYMFPTGAKIKSDIPAILAVGIGYKVMPKMKLSAGLHYYFDKNATIESSPGVKKKIDGNLYEVALGGEYDVTDKVLISAGYLYAKTGVGQGYQTDLSHSLTSNTVGFGGGFKVNEKMLLNLGMLYTMYTSDSKSITYAKYGGLTANETYNRTNIVFSFGIDYRF
jgi:long-chain fatty acid transport protein